MRGVVEHRDRIDELLATYTEGWTLERMPAVDRNVLRLGVCELLYADDVPDAVAVTEAHEPGAGPVDRRVAGASSTGCSARISRDRASLV